MRYHASELRRYLAPFLIDKTADNQGHIYRYNDPLLGDIYSTTCKYLNCCDNIVSYEHMEHIAWRQNGINYGSLMFCMRTDWNDIEVINIYFESEDAE